MTDDHASFRQMAPRALDAALQDARRRTLGLFDALAGAGYSQAAQVPRLAILNPPLWELGHIAWFAEWFVLREARSSRPDDASGPSLLARGDALFDSNTVAHDTRWQLDLPAPDAMKSYCVEVLDKIRSRLAQTPDDDAALYPYRLVLAHEDMHGEALLYTLQTLGAAPPAHFAAGAVQAATPGELAFAGGDVLCGGDPARGFVFDNERPALPCRVAPFAIDAGLVSNAAWLAFMRDGGPAPRYWQRDAAGDGWHTLRFGQRVELDPDEPVRHVSLYQAQAYCGWAGRRLPLEVEWEFAASAGHPDFIWGQLWEWTASPFLPYPGFAADRYREYSAPSFGRCQVLRGASFATPPRLRSPHFRNFYAPERDDVFVGFRTCAP